MGSCSSKTAGYDPVVTTPPRAPSRPVSSTQRQRPRVRHTSSPSPASSNPANKTPPLSGNQRGGQSRPPSASPPIVEKKKSPYMDTKGVQFVNFKDREKTVVESTLVNNRHVKMASIHFEDLKLQKIIGAGAFGEVIKGMYFGTPVVVKRMLRNKIDEQNLKMFSEEIQLMMNLRHPNIVQVRYILL